MPKVGTGKGARRFPYTKAGEAAAEQEAQRTGMPMRMMPPGTKPMMPPAKRGKAKK